MKPYLIRPPQFKTHEQWIEAVLTAEAIIKKQFIGSPVVLSDKDTLEESFKIVYAMSKN